MLMIRRDLNRSQPSVRVMIAYTTQARKWLEEFHPDSIEQLLSLDLSPLSRGESVGGMPVRENQFLSVLVESMRLAVQNTVGQWPSHLTSNGLNVPGKPPASTVTDLSGMCSYSPWWCIMDGRSQQKPSR